MIREAFRFFREPAPDPVEVAKARLAAMVEERARSPEIVQYRRKREAALKGTRG